MDSDGQSECNHLPWVPTKSSVRLKGPQRAPEGAFRGSRLYSLKPQGATSALSKMCSVSTSTTTLVTAHQCNWPQGLQVKGFTGLVCRHPGDTTPTWFNISARGYESHCPCLKDSPQRVDPGLRAGLTARTSTWHTSMKCKISKAATAQGSSPCILPGSTNCLCCLGVHLTA